MENKIVLTMKEQKPVCQSTGRRIEIIERVFRKEITMACLRAPHRQVEAAMVLGVSERQCYRIKAGVKKEGAKGVVHGNRGRACKKKLSEKTEGQIVKLAQGKYRGFNDHHLTEKLKDEEKIELSREKVRQILRAKGIASPRKRRANPTFSTGGVEEQKSE